MKIQNGDGRMIWSGKTGDNPDSTRARKSRLGSLSIIFIVVAMLTMILTSTVYAASEDPFFPDVYVWGESYITGDDGTGTEGYIWGESCIIDGGILDQSLGYAWGE